jgi:hypothetical protein
LESDVFINLPKVKTHKKAGVTLSLKNLIGINADKSWIAHHRRGSIINGGDEFNTLPLKFRIKSRFIQYLAQFKSGLFLLTNFLAPLKRFLYSLNSSLLVHGKNQIVRKSSSCPSYQGNHIVTEGSWYRNDTLWRTILDINRCLLFADANGALHSEKQRRYFTLIDGIIGMEGEGPMEGKAKNAGCLVAAYNPVVSDYVTASIMGMNPNKIPSVRECFKLQEYRLVDFEPSAIELESNWSPFRDISRLTWQNSLKFVPPKGWLGEVEKPDFKFDSETLCKLLERKTTHSSCLE